ncbi:MAG: flagellar transcriptional regulator FlhD [Chromatiales bacterium]|nr:flagellar transcriptional regulator FlhD [Chromatiales bacterium]
MTYDFSQINLQYLIHARDLTRRDPQLAATLTGLADDLAHMLAELTPYQLSQITQIKLPLLIPRQETWWWSRLFAAVREGRAEEIATIMEHATLFTVR